MTANNLAKENFISFMVKNIDFKITYMDQRSDTRTVLYSDFVKYFVQKKEAQVPLMEMMIENQWSTAFGLSMFYKMYNATKILNIDDAKYLNIEGSHLFSNNVLLSAATYIEKGVPMQISHSKDEMIELARLHKRNENLSAWALRGLVIIIIAAIYFYFR